MPDEAGGVPLPDLAAVEARLRDAIEGRPSAELQLLGHGEISIVVGWPGDDPVHALKRVPPFRSSFDADRYCLVVQRYLGLLRAAGVSVWPTTVHVLHRADGSAVVYHRQPVADGSQIGTEVLAAAEPDPEHPLLEAIVTAAVAVTRPGEVGFDVQAANWVWDGVTAHQLDFTSPFVLDASGKDLQFDTDAFLREYPAALRRVLKHELLKLVLRFTTADGAVGDMVGNLYKVGLHQWVEPAVEVAARHGLHVDAATARKMFEDDARLMPLTLKLKKGQRWWMTRTGRHYDSLLPEHTTYGR